MSARKFMITIAAVLVTATAAAAQSTTVYVPPKPCSFNPVWDKKKFWILCRSQAPAPAKIADVR